MKVSVLKAASVAVTVLLGATILLMVVGYAITPWDHYLTLSENIHCSVWNRGLDSRLVVFNNTSYGPYRGSIIKINGKAYPPLVRENAFGDSLGIYYRYFEWSKGKLWTLMVSLWYPLVAFAIIQALQIVRHMRNRAARTEIVADKKDG
jgi:hypothetical protein